MSLNVATLISNCWPPLHATGEADAVFVTESELSRNFSDFAKRLAEKYGLFIERDSTFITLVDGQATYTLPPRHLSTLHVALSGKPLIACSTAELERLDADYTATPETASGRPGPVKRWAQDKQGANTITFYPVPVTALSAGLHPEIIYHRYPCELEDGLDAPKVIGDMLEFQVIGEANQKESDFSCPEITQSCKGLAALYEQVIMSLWSTAQ